MCGQCGEITFDGSSADVRTAIGRRILPAQVIDRPKGYFPVPAVTHLEGKVLDVLRDVLSGDAARARGLFPDAYVHVLLADPARLRGGMLWQLELRLQTHGI
jgi:asparagine synthase (glutamine-hydrolysing)